MNMLQAKIYVKIKESHNDTKLVNSKTDKNRAPYVKQRNQSVFSLISIGGSRTAATSNIEHFVIIVNGFQSLTIVTTTSILDVAAILGRPLHKKN